MKKYIIIFLILIVMDSFLFYYLKRISINRECYKFDVEDKQLIYQFSEIEINNIDEFKFNNYFKILSFDKSSYNYEIIENILNVVIDDIKHEYKINFIRPIIIEKEKIIYKESKKTDSNNNNTIQKPNTNDTKIYVINEYLSYSAGTDISKIISDLGKSVTSYSKITADYSSLNPNQIGQYNIIFSNEYDKKTVIVEIY